MILVGYQFAVADTAVSGRSRELTAHKEGRTNREQWIQTFKAHPLRYASSGKMETRMEARWRQDGGLGLPKQHHHGRLNVQATKPLGAVSPRVKEDVVEPYSR